MQNQPIITTLATLIRSLTVHYYPAPNGVTGNSEDPATAALRLAAPMALYNSSYVDPSVSLQVAWIASFRCLTLENIVNFPLQWINAPVQLLSMLKGFITAAGADGLGIKLAVSEFNFGSDSLVTAAVASAEALAVFVRDGVDSAAVWGQVC